MGRTTIEQIERLFVDRDDVVAEFRQDVQCDETDTPIYHITGEHEIGKSFVLGKFFLECVAQGWLAVMIDFSRGHGKFTDYLSILREIQFALKQPFERYQERTAEELQIPVVRVETGAGNAGTAVGIGAEAELNHVVLRGKFAGRDINNFYIQVSERHIRQSDVIRRLTEAFLEDLVEYVGKRPIVFLFDDIGSDAEGNDFLDSQSRRWLIGDFIIPLCDGLLPQARFVITQRDELETNLQTMLSSFVCRCTLTEFSGDEDSLFEIYRTYLISKQGIPAEDVTDTMLYTFHERVKGRPAEMFRLADSLRRWLRRKRRQIP